MYRMHYVRSRKCYSVRRTTAKQKTQTKKKQKKVFSICTTKDKATRQLRLLRALRYNPNFTPMKN